MSEMNNMDLFQKEIKKTKSHGTEECSVVTVHSGFVKQHVV